MARARRALALLGVVSLLLGLLLITSSCATGDPQNTFAPAGDVARKQRDIFHLALWPAIAILILVEGALVVALLRFRQKGKSILPKQVHGHPQLEVAWTIAPAVLLLVLAVPMIGLVADLAEKSGGDALRIKVVGHQWLWEFQYPDIKDEDGNPLVILPPSPTEPAELYVPVGRQVDAIITSTDVIHSFWVPKLAGKLDAIPGRDNRMWFNATEPGLFSGQCAEFCGIGHANMRFAVVAVSEEEFQEWVDVQLQKQVSRAATGEPRAVSQVE